MSIDNPGDTNETRRRRRSSSSSSSSISSNSDNESIAAESCDCTAAQITNLPEQSVSPVQGASVDVKRNASDNLSRDSGTEVTDTRGSASPPLPTSLPFPPPPPPPLLTSGESNQVIQQRHPSSPAARGAPEYQESSLSKMEGCDFDDYPGKEEEQSEEKKLNHSELTTTTMRLPYDPTPAPTQRKMYERSSSEVSKPDPPSIIDNSVVGEDDHEIGGDEADGKTDTQQGRIITIPLPQEASQRKHQPTSELQGQMVQNKVKGASEVINHILADIATVEQSHQADPTLDDVPNEQHRAREDDNSDIFSTITEPVIPSDVSAPLESIRETLDSASSFHHPNMHAPEYATSSIQALSNSSPTGPLAQQNTSATYLSVTSTPVTFQRPISAAAAAAAKAAASSPASPPHYYVHEERRISEGGEDRVVFLPRVDGEMYGAGQVRLSRPNSFLHISSSQQQTTAPGGRRKIHFRLQEEIVKKSNKRTGILGHIRRRSSRMIYGAEAYSSEDDDDMKRNSPFFSGQTIQIEERGSVTVSWFEGTSTLELQDHVRKCVMRKLRLEKHVELSEIRALDESVDPPEGTVCILDFPLSLFK